MDCESTTKMAKRLKRGTHRATSKRRPKRREKSPEWTPVEGAWIKQFREAKGWTPEQLAERLGLHLTAVYAFERGGDYRPAAETLIKLANLSVATEWKYTRWFLEMAGLDAASIDRISDAAIASRAVASGANVELRDFDPQREEKISLPVALVPNPASTRFIRIPAETIEGEFLPFSSGDILLIDTTEQDLKSLGDHWLMAVLTEPEKSLAALFVGWVVREKKTLRDRAVATFHSLRVPIYPEPVWLGTSVDDGPIEQSSPSQILGRVVGWFGSRPVHRKEKNQK